MTIKAFNAGSLGLSEIRTEFGGPSTNISLFSYRSGGAYVPGGTIGYPRPSGSATAIPSAAPVGINGFYGSSAFVAPTYFVQSAFPTVNEGSHATFNIQTQNVTPGTDLHWRLRTIDEDYVDNATEPEYDDFSTATIGTVTVTGTFSLGNASVNVFIAADQITDPNTEQFALVLSTTLNGASIATSNFVTINDTSQGPTYSISGSPTTVAEGSSVTFTVTTSGVPDNTTLYYAALLGTTTVDDYTGLTYGTFVINANSGSFVLGISADALTEGVETFSMRISATGFGGPYDATSQVITINDTSQAPAFAVTNGNAWSVSYTGAASSTAAINFLGTGAVSASGSTSRYGNLIDPNWGTPTTPGGTSNWYIKFTNVVGTGGIFSSDPAPGAWGLLSTMTSPYLSLTNPGGGAAIISRTTTVQISSTPNDGGIVSTNTLALNAEVPISGGGGGGSVLESAFLVSGILAGEAAPGDELTLLSPDLLGTISGEVISNRLSIQNLVTLVSESGIELTCSDNTPLTLRDGSSINSTGAFGVDLPVLDEQGFRWEKIVEVRDAGQGTVATIYCQDQCYGAGNSAGRYIFTHNNDQQKN